MAVITLDFRHLEDEELHFLGVHLANEDAIFEQAPAVMDGLLTLMRDELEARRRGERVHARSITRDFEGDDMRACFELQTAWEYFRRPAYGLPRVSADDRAAPDPLEDRWAAKFYEDVQQQLFVALRHHLSLVDAQAALHGQKIDRRQIIDGLKDHRWKWERQFLRLAGERQQGT